MVPRRGTRLAGKVSDALHPSDHRQRLCLVSSLVPPPLHLILFLHAATKKSTQSRFRRLPQFPARRRGLRFDGIVESIRYVSASRRRWAKLGGFKELLRGWALLLRCANVGLAFAGSRGEVMENSSWNVLETSPRHGQKSQTVLQYNTILQYNAIQYDTKIQYYNIIQYNKTKWYSTIQYSTILQYSKVP